jgi:transposase
MGYIQGTDRRQNVLFPGSLEEYVDENNPVRVIGAFLGALDFRELGFVRGEAAETGRPGYDPRLMMGLYIWGQMNRMRGTRRLERECGRNVEVMWLMENLRPDFKTIADFRKNNGEPIRQVVVKFRLWCMSEGLYGREMVGVDGSKFKAANSRERNFTRKKLANLIARERAQVEQYLSELDAVDEEEADDEAPPSGEELKEKLGRIKERLREHEELEQEMKAGGAKQISQTDKDARLMTTASGSQVGYNVQMVVDHKHKLIAEYDVTNEGNDHGQLARMGEKAKAALQTDELVMVADSGYFEGGNIKQCEAAGITPYLPVPRWPTAEKSGLFGANRFSYDEERDLYACPQGEELTFRKIEKRKGKHYRIYRTGACHTCPLRMQCTRSKYGRKFRVWADREVVDRLRQRMRERPELMRERKNLCEHPYGTIKRAMGVSYFLLKGRQKVAIETGLAVLAYNLKRVINILGVEKMVTALSAGVP